MTAAVGAPSGACAPLRVLERLRAAPDGPVPVVHAGHDAVYVDVGGWCVGVVGPRAADVPCALRVVGPYGVLGPDAGPARVAAGVLHLRGRALPVRRLVDVSVPRLGATVLHPARPAPPVLAGVELPEAPLRAEDARRLVGRGPGLTPLGDDVLAGWLALHRAAGVATPEVDAVVGAAREHTTLLSATLLECARRGEVAPAYAAWVRALGTPGEAAGVGALHALGASSGAGLHAGGLLALAGLRTAVAA